MHVVRGTGRRFAALVAAGLVGVAVAGPAHALEGLVPPVPAASSPAETTVAEVAQVTTTVEGAVAAVAEAAVSTAPEVVESAPPVPSKELPPTPVKRVVEVATGPLAPVRAAAVSLREPVQAIVAAKLPPTPRASAVVPRVSTVRSRSTPSRKVELPSARPIAAARPPQKSQARRAGTPVAPRVVEAKRALSLPSFSSQTAEHANRRHAAQPPVDWFPLGGIASGAATSAGSVFSGGAEQPAAPLALFFLLSLPLLMVAARSRGAPVSPGALTPLERPG